MSKGASLSPYVVGVASASESKAEVDSEDQSQQPSRNSNSPSHSMSQSHDSLVHLPIPEKPKYTRFKPTTIPLEVQRASQQSSHTSTSQERDASAAFNSDIDQYSPTHFQMGVLSPVYRGGPEVVFDPTRAPAPPAAISRQKEMEIAPK